MAETNLSDTRTQENTEMCFPAFDLESGCKNLNMLKLKCHIQCQIHPLLTFLFSIF